MPYRFALFIMTFVIFINCLSCTTSQHANVISSVLTNGDGNTFVASRIERSAGDHDIQLRKFNSEGAILWDKELFTGDDRRANVIGMVNTGDNGVFIAWEVLTPEDGKEGSHHFDSIILMKIDGQGETQLRQDLFAKGMQMVDDGMGGIILGWATKEDHRVLREDGQGSTLWAHPISSHGTGLKLASGEDGESFILWRHLDNPYFVVQKLGADGQTLWGQEDMPEGVRIKHLDTALPPEPQIISDGSGGAIISWAEPLGEGLPSYVWICRIGADGQVICEEPSRDLTSTVNTQIRAVADSPLGVVVIWEDHRDGIALYAIRDNPLSSFLWPENGVSVCTDIPEISPRFDAISDGEGGVVVAWTDGNHKLFAQMLDSFGNKQWGERGILVADVVCDLPVMISGDRQKGFIIGWCTGEETHHPEGSYIQKLDSQGNLLWGKTGLKLSEQN